MDVVDQMRTFVRIVDTGSLSAAARGSGLSLAAVSRQLAALEADLGSALIVRSTRRLQVTPSGRRWYAHCARILRELEEARADVAGGAQVRGTVVISAPITVGMTFVVPKLERLAAAHPRLDVQLRLEDHVVDLVGDAVDIAVRGGIAPPDSTAIVAHPLFEFRRVAVASPAYLRRRGLPRHPRELEHHDALVQGSLGPTFARWRFEKDGEHIELAPRGHLHSTAPIVLRDWALAGAGIALLPDWLVAPPLRALLPDWTTPAIHTWALHRVELRGAPRIRAALAALAA